MRIPDELRKCVAFLQFVSNRQRHFAGTVFFLTMEMNGRHFHYAVTARHIIERLKALSDDQTAIIRMNRKDVGTVTFDTHLNDWWFHPTDNSIDVAVHQLNEAVWPGEADHMVFPISSVITEETSRQEDIGIGSETLIVGLFRNHIGEQRNIPIVRIGNIAAMPEEQVATKEFGYIEAYLLETRSISGVSGSPVFVTFPDQNLLAFGASQQQATVFYLLGLAHGHYDESVDKPKLDIVNTGIAIVVPAWKIIEVLNHPQLSAIRTTQT